MEVELSARKKAILKAVIDVYVETGEPVGSKSLTQSKQFDLSSATIRNEMAELEALGYLEQPHTSAGRIPTELGYRLYVDGLMQDYALSAGELAQLNAMLRAKTAELDKMIQNAGKVVANLTNYTAIAMRQGSDQLTVTRFSITPVDEHNFLLVMVMSDRSAKTRFVRTEMALNEQAADALEQVLNNFVSGRDLSAVTLPYMVQMENCLGPYGALISPIMKFVYEAVGRADEKDLRVDGVEKLLEYPEFLDSGKLKDVLGMLDRKDELLQLVSRADDDVTIVIGKENGVEALEGSSLVFKKIVVDGKTVGAVGVIGPTRMDYSRVVSAIRYLAGGISQAMNLPESSGLPQMEAPKNELGKDA